MPGGRTIGHSGLLAEAGREEGVEERHVGVLEHVRVAHLTDLHVGRVTPRIVQHNSLVGQRAGAALSQFGKPRLDVAEGAGRKLQFAGAACILDIYYYAPKQGAEPVATHVDARTPEGRDANVDSCVNALRR